MQAQMHKKQQRAEHKLQVGHIKSLENDIGAANMHKIYNNSIVQAQKKRKMDTTVDLTTEDKEDQNPMLSVCSLIFTMCLFTHYMFLHRQ